MQRSPLLHPQQVPLGASLCRAVRGHWGIENRLHWQLDVTFQEGQCRIRKGRADTKFSILRRAALAMLKNERTLKVGMKNKRLSAGWNSTILNKSLSERDLWCNRPEGSAGSPAARHCVSARCQRGRSGQAVFSRTRYGRGAVLASGPTMMIRSRPWCSVLCDSGR